MWILNLNYKRLEKSKRVSSWSQGRKELLETFITKEQDRFKYMKIQKLCMTKDSIKEISRQATIYSYYVKASFKSIRKKKIPLRKIKNRCELAI